VTTAEIELILNKHPNSKRDALIPILQEIQQAYGHLSREAVILIGRHLGLPASKIYGVATFYNQFRFRAPGKFHVQVCRGTACHVKGSVNVLETAVKALGIQPGETTRDGLFSLEVVACLGACGLAPVVAVNGEFYAGMTSEALLEVLAGYRDGKTGVAVGATAGAEAESK
jgi:NADH-quinone oxidoreductase subunit E